MHLVAMATSQIACVAMQLDSATADRKGLFVAGGCQCVQVLTDPLYTGHAFKQQNAVSDVRIRPNKSH